MNINESPMVIYLQGRNKAFIYITQNIADNLFMNITNNEIKFPLCLYSERQVHTEILQSMMKKYNLELNKRYYKNKTIYDCVVAGRIGYYNEEYSIIPDDSSAKSNILSFYNSMYEINSYGAKVSDIVKALERDNNVHLDKPVYIETRPESISMDKYCDVDSKMIGVINQVRGDTLETIGNVGDTYKYQRVQARLNRSKEAEERTLAYESKFNKLYKEIINQ